MNPSNNSLLDDDPWPARATIPELCGSAFDTSTMTMHQRIFSRGDIIFFPGAAATGLYHLNQGNVKIYKMRRDGREQTVRMSRPGDIFGYHELLTGSSHEAFAAALDHVELTVLSKETFYRLLATNQLFAASLLQILASELEATESWVCQLVQHSVRERTAEMLLLLKERYGLLEDHETLAIRLTRAELSNILGTAPESVSRVLSKFQQEGLIVVRGRTIRLINIDALLDVTA